MDSVEQTDHAKERLASRFLQACRLNNQRNVTIDEVEEEKFQILMKTDQIRDELGIEEGYQKFKVTSYSELLGLNVYFIILKSKNNDFIIVKTLWTDFESFL